MKTMRPALAMLGLLALAACQSIPPMSGAVHWYRNSAEMRAIYLQTYATAARQLQEMTEGFERGSWGVIMDVDETLLDNSGYVVEFGRYTPATWDIWTARQGAPALPGAVAFTERVRRDLGGRVVLVTNRAQHACDDTRHNLERVAIGYDDIHCMSETDDKDPRFALVQSGSPGAPPLNIVMWLGDNIEDFPGLSQQDPDLTPFGTRFFAFPNPSYGSWEDLPRE